MAHTRKQGGKELLWMLGIPTVIAAGIFYWFINDVDSQFATKPAYVASTNNSTTQNLPPVSTQNIPANQPIAPVVVAASVEPAPAVQTETASPETTTTPAPVTEQTVETAPAQTTTATAPDPVAEQTVASETTPSAATEEAVTAQNEANAVALPTFTTPEPPLTESTNSENNTDTDTTASSELTAIEIADTTANPTTTNAAEQGASGAAGPSDTPTETTPTAQTETEVEPASTEPTDTGWIYIGQFRNNIWKSSGFDILDQMPKVGEKYTLTWGANIRAQPPAKRTVTGETPQLAENVGYLAIGKQVEVLNIRRSGNKGHIWVEIPR